MKAKKEPTLPKPDPAEYARIAAAIGQISDVAKGMRTSGLSSKAIVVLIQHATGLSQSDIKRVLTATEELRSWCLTR